MKRILFFTILLCLSASLVVGQTLVIPGGAIPDNNDPDGLDFSADAAEPDVVIADFTCTDGTVIAGFNGAPEIGVTHEVVSVAIAELIHTWAGDVTLTLTDPSGNTVTLVDGVCGTNEYDPSAPYVFMTGAAAGGIGDNCAEPIAPGTYNPDTPLTAFSGPLNGTWTLNAVDAVGGDTGEFADATITFAPLEAPDQASQCPVVCELTGCEDQEIPLEPGECQEIAFFDVQLGSSCGEIQIFTDPMGTATSAGNATATDNGDGSVDFVSAPGNGGGDVANFTWTTPACAAGNVGVSFDYEYANTAGTFWDEFTIDGPNGNIVDESAFSTVPSSTSGSVFESAPPGGVYEVELVNTAFGTGGATASISNYQAVCGSGFELEQTSGIESGEFLAAGCYPIVYTATPVSQDQMTGELTFDDANAIVCEMEICVTEYSGPVTEALACNDHVNISLDENCEVVLSADMFLEGGPYACFDDYPVSILAFGAGDPIAIEAGVPISLPCGDHTAMVTSPLGNTCWGTFTIEDKIAPTFTVTPVEVTCVEDVPVILVSPFDAGNAPLLEEPVAIDDAAPSTVVFDYEFPCEEGSSCEITDVDLYVSLVHSWIGDLDIVVTTPGGASIDIIDFGGCFGQDWVIDAIFDEECPNDLMNDCNNFDAGGECVWSAAGLLGSLSSLYGEDACGTWTVEVTDNFAGDGGTLNELNLIINNGDGSCDISPVFPVADASDCDCQSYSFSDISSPSDCGDGTITRTWVCTDKAGNTSDGVVQTITVSPLGLDQLGDTWFVPPALIELPCGTGTDPWDIVAFFDDPTTEDCDDSDPDCPAVYEFNEGVAFGFPHYAAWGCNDRCNAKNEEHFQPIDNNVCNLFVTFSDQNLAACGLDCAGNTKVIRTWTVLDWCTSETLPFVQIIKATDNENPEITATDITLSVNPWGCVASGALPAPEHLFDGCSKDLTYTVSGPAGVSIFSINGDGTAPYGLTGAPIGEHTFTYTAVDCCGNVGTSTMTVTVVDDTPPTAIAKENIVISLTSGGFDEGGTAKLYTGSVDNGSHDGDCGNVTLEIRRVDAPDCGNIGVNGYNNNNTFNDNRDPEDNNNDTDGGQFVKFCCADLEGGDTYEGPNGQIVTFVEDVTVVLRVFDANGNFNETWANVRVENKLPPVIVCPPDAEIGCNMDWSLHLDGAAAPTEQELAMLTAPDFGTGIATGAGVCGAVSITYEDRYNEDICYDRNNEITREWCIEGTNICCDQKIDIVKVGAFDPMSISWNSGFPEEEIFEDCIYDHTDQEPSWTEAPCDLIAWTVSSDTFYIEGNAAAFGCIKVVNDYTVVDWCADEEYTFTQVIKVIDEEAPVLTVPEVCVPVVDGCTAGVTLCAVATDMGECESPWLKWEVLVDLYGDWSYDHVFSTYVSPLDPNFGTGVNEYYIPASAPGEEVCITLPESVPSSKYDHRVIWKVSDGCGNFTSVTETFQVVDKKAPTPYCLSVSSALMTDGSVELWACDFVIGGEDNCTPIDWMRYTFTGPDADGNFPDVELGDTGCEARTFTCDDISSTSNVVMVDVYSWDECDNFAVCAVELTLTPEGCEFGDDEGSNRMAIAGAVGTEFGELLGDVNVSIVSNQPEYPMTIKTDNNGEYASDNHLTTQDYAVSAYNNDDPRNGVSTLDILLIQRHILNLQTLTSPYQYIAADANSDGAITAADLVDIRKLVLEIYDEFPSNTSWRFVDAAQALTTSNAFAFNEVIDILALNADMTNENFIATKTGDVNNSVVLSATGNDTEARNGNLNLNLTGVATSEGVSVEVTSANFRAIAGYQFTMNTNGMELASVEAGAINMTDDNVAVLDANTVTMSWNTTSPVTVANEVLFTLNFVGTDANAVADMDITSEVTAAEAYDADLSVLNVVLGDNAAAAFALEQNEPNPFSTQTTVEFSLPTAGTATLTVMDVTGKMVKQITGTYAKGANSIVLTKAELATSGVLYYQLESGDFSATKKMIIIE